MRCYTLSKIFNLIKNILRGWLKIEATVEKVATAPMLITEELKIGDSGDSVVNLQHRLYMYSMSMAEMLENTVFKNGCATVEFTKELEKVVKEFQLSNGLDVTGVVGVEEIEILNTPTEIYVNTIEFLQDDYSDNEEYDRLKDAIVKIIENN